MPSSLDKLQPSSVWAHFATLCAIPRPSLHEAALREHLIGWAQARGIGAIVDGVGNLILKKLASPGCEALPGVILQGHLDMVCQANSGTRHDFKRDPIRAAVRDGWVVAEHTTLGVAGSACTRRFIAQCWRPGAAVGRPPAAAYKETKTQQAITGVGGFHSTV